MIDWPANLHVLCKVATVDGYAVLCVFDSVDRSCFGTDRNQPARIKWFGLVVSFCHTFTRHMNPQ